MAATITLLHGFSQTTASFDPLRAALARHGISSDTPKLPGHGTGVGPDRIVDGDLWQGADTLVANRAPGCWLGYSMGARLALHVALAHPEAVTGLVLIGGTAGIDDPDERRARRTSDDDLAERITRIGVEAFLADWLTKPLFATLPEDPDRIARRASNTAAGLASSLRRWGTGTMDPPLWERLSSITAPTLVLAGSFDEKFTTLGRRMVDHLGGPATYQPVADAVHAAHIERPTATAGLIADWFQNTLAM